MKIGNAVKHLREKAGISQKDLSVKCNITPSALSYIERGTSAPWEKTVHKLAKALATTPAELYKLSITLSENKADTTAQP